MVGDGTIRRLSAGLVAYGLFGCWVASSEVPSIVIGDEGHVRLLWNAVPGKSYSIFRSSDLNHFRAIAKGFPFGGAQGGTLEFRDSAVEIASVPKRFYRVERDSILEPSTAERLESFYSENGGKKAFPENQVRALEGFLYAQDELEAGQREAARRRVDSIFAELPLSENRWRSGVGYQGLHFGDTPAYYGLRMLDQILDLKETVRDESLQMTAVVATRAVVSRPTLPDLAPETVQLDVAPEILADNGRLLHVVTQLFRRWVQAITGGYRVDLVVYVLDENANVSFTDDGNIVRSYPDAHAMIDAVPAQIVNDTDFWWVIAPSGVPGDGSGYDRHFITGGMGIYGRGLPLFLSDDAWFTRKPEHLGHGVYTEIEARAYQPQWFQHEFMHHLYRVWSEFGLEESPHQWFVRATWPEDFVGVWESDYYSESIGKRLLAATPSLIEGLRAPMSTGLGALRFAILSEFATEELVGRYRREPVENPWHEVDITIEQGEIRWRNAADVAWSLEIRGDDLWAGADSAYGASKLRVEIDAENNVAAVYFLGERYRRTD